MLDHAPVPLVLMTGQGALHAVNRAARRLFGADDRIAGADHSLARAIAEAHPGQRALIQLADRPGGAPRGFALSVAHWSAADGPALLAALTDVQAELRAAEAAVLQDVLQTLSHEIMNSLTPVMSLAETAGALLADHGAASLPAAQDALETIARRAQGLERFVRGYRALARVPAPVPRPASLRLLLRDVARLFETRWAASGVRLNLALPEPDIVATIDSGLIGQALMALLTNGAEAALDHVPRPPSVTLTAGVSGAQVWFRVADSGAGVPEELREEIFRPLFTGKPGGTGIGLGIARQIALAHGGALILEPPDGAGGAAFTLHVG
jgi:signal transduction histidine kinase